MCIIYIIFVYYAHSSHNYILHRVVITDPENSNKMADANQPQNYSAFIERRNTNRSFSWYVLIISIFFQSQSNKMIE